MIGEKKILLYWDMVYVISPYGEFLEKLTLAVGYKNISVKFHLENLRIYCTWL